MPPSYYDVMADGSPSSQDKQLSRSVRDLHWCLHSAPLIAEPPQGHPTNPRRTTEADEQVIWPTQAWYEGLLPDDTSNDTETEPPSPPDPQHFRLGLHFEALIRHWLAMSSQYTLVKHNWQVIANKRTIGEFDLIVRDQLTGELEHWELAIKFYLGTGDLSWPNWYGPNPSDRLDLKTNRLVTHQLTLSTQPEPSALLEAEQLSIKRVRCFMKGRLYYPHRQNPHPHYPQRNPHPLKDNPASTHDAPLPQVKVHPAHVHHDHNTGWWLTSDGLRDAFDASSRFIYLPKRLWLSSLTADDVADTLDLSDVTTMLHAPRAQQAIQFAEVTHEGEISRGFVVSSRWLERVG